RAGSRCSGSTCGSTPTTSSTRTAAPTTSRRGGTWSTGGTRTSSTPPPAADGGPRTMRARLGRPARAAAAASILTAAVSSALASEIVAVKAGLLIDGTGAPPRKNAVVLVQDGKILAVGILAPTGARVIDLGDRTLLPGFIDCQVQLAGRSPGEAAGGDG